MRKPSSVVASVTQQSRQRVPTVSDRAATTGDVIVVNL